MKLDGNLVLHACLRCSFLRASRCDKTGEEIKYAASGPIPANCPLPSFEERGDADEISALGGPALPGSEGKHSF